MVRSDYKKAVLEIGTEELPARYMSQALEDSRSIAMSVLEAARLDVARVYAYGTPRRIIVSLDGVAPAQADLVRELRGPAVRIAYDEDGNPTRAAQGFARSAGIPATELVRRDTPQGEYVYATVREDGHDAAAVLGEAFPQIIDSLRFPKSMRWGWGDLRFARPIRWILALLDEDVVDFDYHGVRSGRVTWGHRTLAPGPAEIASASDYSTQLREMGVMIDPKERADEIRNQAQSLAEAHGGTAVVEDDLLEEVTFLVEWPTAFAGEFSRGYLDLPEPCVITPMVGHQRYFPVRKSEGHLMPVFIGVRNGDDYRLDLVTAGNERVLAARLADARFFYEEDMKVPLAERTPDLEDVVFQEKLGTMYEKAERIRTLGCQLVEEPDDTAVLERAAFLAKADLVTAMVREFTELQGVMGREYALRQGEDGRVAQAIFEHYLPRHAGDILPGTRVGAALSVADKMDTVMGYFAIGLVPSGSADPYALRRQAAGMLAVHAQWKFVRGLDDLARLSADLYREAGVIQDSGERLVRDVLEFLAIRLKVSLQDSGIRHDIADAAIASGVGMPACVWEKAHAVASVVDEDWFARLATAVTRIRNIAGNSGPGECDPGLFEDPAEIGLYDAIGELRSDLAVCEQESSDGFVERDAYVGALKRTAEICGDIDRYFDEVLVMVDDERIKRNRLATLKQALNVASSVIDVTRIVFAGD